MKFAYPVNDKGQKTGDIQQFSDMVWERINKQIVKRWVLTEDPRIVNKNKLSKDSKKTKT